MIVILDTNIIYQDFYFKSIDFEMLYRFMKTKGISLYIPQIVIDEAQNKYRERLTEDIKSINSAFNKFNGHVKHITNIEHSKINQNEIITNYKNFQYKKFFQLDVKIVEYPDVKHEIIVQRCLERKKPFSNKDNGYKDYLIWLNVLSVSESNPNEEIYFISTNVNDFSKNNDNEFHDDLKQDLNFKNLAQRVFYFKSLNEFINSKINPYLEKLNLSYTNIITLHIDNHINNILYDLMKETGMTKLTEMLSEEYEDPTIASVSNIRNLKLESLNKLLENELLLEIYSEADCTIDFFLHKWDYFEFNDNDNFSILNEQWNDDYMLAEETISCSFKFRILYNENNNELISIDLENINIIF